MSHRPELDLPIRAAVETAAQYGIVSDRCDILQDGHTLVLRLTTDLVARVVNDPEGPRRGTEWFEKEAGIAQHLSSLDAPVIPLHPAISAGPHTCLGFTLNFWTFVSRVEDEPTPSAIGTTLYQCHRALSSYTGALPALGIIAESLALLEQPTVQQAFAASTLSLLRRHLTTSLDEMQKYPAQPLHGDAHYGNLMNTTHGLLWTDWEDAFIGPVEWDLASIIWNARLLEEDHATADGILEAYQSAGGSVNEAALQHCLTARAAVMSAWYPVLYPNPNPERKNKLQKRLDWLERR